MMNELIYTDHKLLIYSQVITGQIICSKCADQPMTGYIPLEGKVRYNALGDRKVTCSVCGSLR